MNAEIDWLLSGSELQAFNSGVRLTEDRVRELVRLESVHVPNAPLPARIKIHPYRAALGIEILLTATDIIVRPVAYIGDQYSPFEPNQRNVLIGNRLAAVAESGYADLTQELARFNIQVLDSNSLDNILRLRLSDSHILIFGQYELASENMPPSSSESPHPHLLHANLFEYQIRGLQYLLLMRSIASGCVLGDEMGLGKTMQAIALLCSEIEKSRVPNLIVCPATLCRNWKRELEKFAPSVHVLEHSGPLRSGSAALLREQSIVITSYETLASDEALMGRIAWNVVVLDEAQAIKNSGSLRAKVAKSLDRKFSLAVTGTPIENHLEDLWSILDFAEPSILGSLQSFRSMFDDTIVDAQDLHKITAPLILRRRTDDVDTDLPELIQIQLPLEMSPEERSAYDSRFAEIQGGAIPALVGVQELRMICALADNMLTDFKKSAKIQRLTEILEEVFQNNQKAIVFGSYTAEIDNIASCIQDIFPNALVSIIDGRINPNQRTDLVEEYTRHDGPAVFVLNPRAAGVGLNITAATCVIHFNPEWNPAVTDQATKRAHRTGSSKAVTVFHFCFENSLEERIVARSAHRRLLATNGTPGSQDEPDMSDIAWLLGREKEPNPE